MCIKYWSIVLLLKFVIAEKIANNLPCEYDSSLDISSGILNKNGSITHNGILYRYGLYSMVNYIMENRKEKPVKPYARACIYKDSLPCKFSESIRIAVENSKPDINGTITFNHMKFPKGTYANVFYDYKLSTRNITNEANENITVSYVMRVKVPIYLRGCVCNRKPCIRFCCPDPYQKMKGHFCGAHMNVDLPILKEDDQESTSNYKNNFYYVTKRLCGHVTIAEDEFEIDDVGLIYYK